MTKKKERGFVFLPSFASFIGLLPEEQQLEAFWAITKYGLYGERPVKGSMSSAFLELIIPVIDASQNRYKAAVENGKKGGRPKTNPTNNQNETRIKPEPKQNGNQDIDKELDIEKEVDKEEEIEKETQPSAAGAANASGRKKPVKNYYPLDEKLNQTVIDFIDNRKKIKAPMTDRAIEMMLSKLEDMTTDNNEKIAILEQSIINGWKGIFPVMKEKTGDGQRGENTFLKFAQELAETEGDGIF